MHDLTDREARALDTLEANLDHPNPNRARLAAIKRRELLDRGTTVAFAGALVDVGRRDTALEVLTRLFEDAEGEALEPTAGRCLGCRQTIDPGDVVGGGHVVPDHVPGCAPESCGSGCPVAVLCGPVEEGRP